MNLENIPVLKDLVNFWKNLEKSQKRNIIIVLVVALLAIGDWCITLIVLSMRFYSVI